MSFINHTINTIATNKKVSKDSINPKREYKRQWTRKNRVLEIAKTPITLPQPDEANSVAEVPKPLRFHLIPDTYAIVKHTNTLYPPTITPTTKGIQEFPLLLQMLSQLGRHYGGLKLCLPPIETGKEWFKTPVSKPLSKIDILVRNQVFEELTSSIDDGGKAYTVASLPAYVKMSRWHNQIIKKEDYQLIGTMDSFWEKVNKEVEKSKNQQSKIRPYGVDTDVSMINMDRTWTHLFNNDWNLLLTLGLDSIPGITTPYVYFGTPGTAFAWHVEDYHCHSANTLIDGAPKIWHIIPGHCMQMFVTESKATIEELEITTCPQALRHQGFVLSSPPLTPEAWKKSGYACYQFTQAKGEMIIVWPGAYHSGINSGWNLAEAMNFATEDWLSEGKKYQPCNCEVAPTEPIVLDLNIIEEAVEKKSGKKGKKLE